MVTAYILSSPSSPLEKIIGGSTSRLTCALNQNGWETCFTSSDPHRDKVIVPTSHLELCDMYFLANYLAFYLAFYSGNLYGRHLF